MDDRQNAYARAAAAREEQAAVTTRYGWGPWVVSNSDWEALGAVTDALSRHTFGGEGCPVCGAEDGDV